MLICNVWRLIGACTLCPSISGVFSDDVTCSVALFRHSTLWRHFVAALSRSYFLYNLSKSRANLHTYVLGKEERRCAANQNQVTLTLTFDPLFENSV